MTAPKLLPLQNLAPMLVSGLIFQACASGRFSFAAAAWFCLVPLATLARAASLPLFLGTSFAVVLLGRLIGWHGVLLVGGEVADGATVVAAAATAAALTVGVLAVHRLCMRELPILGPQAMAAAVVAVEFACSHFGLPLASLLPLSTSQAGDVPFVRFVDVLTPLGLSFCVAWAQGVLAGYGEAWLAPDPHPQKVRERGLRIASNLCFWIIVIGFHIGGFLRSPDVTAGTHTQPIAIACAAYLALCLVLAVVSAIRRKA